MMNSKYTFVFEYTDGNPTICAKTSFLGGKMCSVAFHDAMEENENLQSRIDNALELLEIKSSGDDFDDVIKVLSGKAGE